MKNILKKLSLILVFFSFTSTILFGGSFSFYSDNYFGNYKTLANHKTKTKNNLELTCTTYEDTYNIYIEIKFKNSSPSYSHLKKVLNNSIDSIDFQDSRLDSAFGYNMTINYIFYDKNDNCICSATYVE